MALLSTIAAQLTNFGIQTSIYVFPDSAWPGVVSQSSTKYAMMARYSVPGFGIILPSLFPANGYFEGYPINITHWNGVVRLPVDIELPNGTVIPANTTVNLFGGSSIGGMCIQAAAGSLENVIKCLSLFSWFNNIDPWVILLITPHTMVWYNDQYLQFPPSSSWVWAETPALEIGGPFLVVYRY
nr:MAG: hypothetical protein TU35_08210 [Thermoproteus sp. AZ2]